MGIQRNLVALVSAALLAADPIIPASRAGEGANGAAREVGEGFKKLGKTVGEVGKEVGQEVARGAKKIWYKGKKVSAPLLRDVQRATREFWSDLIAGKDRTIEQLRDENARLKGQLEGKKKNGE